MLLNTKPPPQHQHRCRLSLFFLSKKQSTPRENVTSSNFIHIFHFFCLFSLKPYTIFSVNYLFIIQI